MENDNLELEKYTLTDEEGNEEEFVLVGSLEDGGQTYVALIPAEADENDDECEFVILRVVQENGEDVFVSIDDDDEFERIADIFEDELEAEFDYDEDDEEEEEDEDEDEEESEEE